jgi:predicted RNA binding protein YcfA (HicA-like mRNA interferase family)
VSNVDRIADAFKTCRGPFPYRDLVRLLEHLGYREASTGGGSRRKFVHIETRHIIRLHQPHPGNEIREYVVRQIRTTLSEQDLI